MLLILESISFGFNSSCTMRLQPVLVPACFLAAFCYFFFFLELVNYKVRLKSNFTVWVMKCKQMWLFHATLCPPHRTGVRGWCLAPWTTSPPSQLSVATTLMRISARNFGFSEHQAGCCSRHKVDQRNSFKLQCLHGAWCPQPLFAWP